MAGVRDNTVTNVVSGNIASFKNVGQVPLKSLKINFNPIQEGDGDPSKEMETHLLLMLGLQKVGLD